MSGDIYYIITDAGRTAVVDCLVSTLDADAFVTQGIQTIIKDAIKNGGIIKKFGGLFVNTPNHAALIAYYDGFFNEAVKLGWIRLATKAELVIYSLRGTL